MVEEDLNFSESAFKNSFGHLCYNSLIGEVKPLEEDSHFEVMGRDMYIENLEHLVSNFEVMCDNVEMDLDYEI